MNKQTKLNLYNLFNLNSIRLINRQKVKNNKKILIKSSQLIMILLIIHSVLEKSIFLYNKMKNLLDLSCVFKELIID